MRIVPCTSITVVDAVPGGEYKVILEVAPESWGNIADTAARLADFLSGVSVFGHSLDTSLFTGWDVVKVEYTGNTIEIYFKETGSPAIIAVLAVLWPYIQWLLVACGIILLGYKILDLLTGIVEHSEANAQREQDKLRAECIMQQLNDGRSIEDAITICGISYPSPKDDMGKIILIGVAILGAAYLIGRERK